MDISDRPSVLCDFTTNSGWIVEPDAGLFNSSPCSFRTVTIDGKVVGIFGCSMTYDGVGYLSMWLTSRFKETYIALLRHIKKYTLPNFLRDEKPRKLYITVLDTKEFRSWATFFGFIEEFRMVEAGPQKMDLIGYSMAPCSVPTTNYTEGE
jgi:hypothetical protein